MTRSRILIAILLLIVLAGAGVARAELKPAKRPFLWMNQQEIEAAKRRWKEPWAKKAMEVALASRKDSTGTFRDLFHYQVLGDENAGNRQKAALLGFIGRDIEKSKPRDDDMMDVIRYDVFYDQLTPAQRKGIEDTMRKHIDWLLFRYWRGPKFEDANYTRKSKYFPDFDPTKPVDVNDKEPGVQERVMYNRMNWLPNMLYPRNQGVFLMALALQDEALIREVFETKVAGMKWMLDVYIGDGAFYMEEFGKQSSIFGEMMLWCRGCKRLGLDELGFDYVGKPSGAPGQAGGATMQKYCMGRIQLGYPRVDQDGGLPHYYLVTMGDAGIRHHLAQGSRADDELPANPRWAKHNMQGPAPRMQYPLVFELAHKQWPEGRFDYILAQMRQHGDDKYYPSLFFDVEPIDPKAVKPPLAPSYVAPERGFAMLRAEEGGDYWTSDSPAAALQFGSYYVHYVHDCLSVMQYYGYREALLGNLAFGPHSGYAGGHPWRDSVRGHNGIVVDSMQAQPVDTGEHGSAHQQIRHAFSDGVKFVAVRCPVAEPASDKYLPPRRSDAIYPGVDIERALILTDDYMLDISRMVSDKPRVYDWNYLPVGAPLEDAGWAPSSDLDGGKLFKGMPDIVKKHGKNLSAGEFDLSNVHRKNVGTDAWSIAVRQGNGVGLKIHMLPGADTTVYRSVGHGVTATIARRNAPATTFIAVHEPFKDKPGKITKAELLEATGEGIAVRVSGPGIDDTLLFAFGPAAERDVTIAGTTFKGHAFVRGGKKEEGIARLAVDMKTLP